MDSLPKKDGLQVLHQKLDALTATVNAINAALIGDSYGRIGLVGEVEKLKMETHQLKQVLGNVKVAVIAWSIGAGGAGGGLLAFLVKYFNERPY